MNTVFGLDFGTTNSALSVNNNGHVDILAVGGIYVGGDNFDSQLMWDEGGFFIASLFYLS